MTSSRNLVLAIGLAAAFGCKSDKTALRDERFETRRDIRVNALEAELQVINTQPVMINAIAQSFPLTAASRADVTDKLQKLQMRYDEAKNQVEGLKAVAADQFNAADDKTRDAMDKLHRARKDAWDAVTDARRTDRSS